MLCLFVCLLSLEEYYLLFLRFERELLIPYYYSLEKGFTAPTTLQCSEVLRLIPKFKKRVILYLL